MLLELSIRNLTLIDRIDLSFEKGLTVLTGETGAGKSILLDALWLIAGHRAQTDWIREGQDHLEVCAQFYLNETTQKHIKNILNPLGLEPILEEESTLVIRRLVHKEGRHRQWVNGCLVNLAHLREIAEPLVDFTGQHAQQDLLKPKQQLMILDAYAQQEDLLGQMKEAFLAFKKQQKVLQELQKSNQERALRLDFLEFQIKEIEQSQIKPGEYEHLKQLKDKLSGLSKLKDESRKACFSLQNITCLDEAIKAVQKIQKYDDSLNEILDCLNQAKAYAQEAAFGLNRYLRLLEGQEWGSLEEIEERIFVLKKLFKKHGEGEDAILAACQSMKAEKENLDDLENLLLDTQKELEKAQSQAIQIAQKLSQKRQEAAARLCVQVKKEIADLGLCEALLEVRAEATEILTEQGQDSVRFWFSANPGEPLNWIEKVVSGGELSRVLLGLKRVLMTEHQTLVSVFDEVDTGVGGAIAQAIGEKLLAISKGRQVLCVTHLPQVAALAQTHFKVEKEIQGNRTYSFVKTLDKNERIDEIARMLSGKTVTQTTKQHAKEYLELNANW